MLDSKVSLHGRDDQMNWKRGKNTVLTYVLISVIATLAGWAGALRTVNLSVKKGNEKLVLEEARSLAKKLEKDPSDPAAVLKKWAQKRNGTPSLVRSLPRSPDATMDSLYLAASTSPLLKPGPLQSQTVEKQGWEEAKRIYDRSIKTLHENRDLIQWISLPEKEELVGASVLLNPRKTMNDERQTREILVLYMVPEYRDFSWPFVSWLLVVIIPGLILCLWLWKTNGSYRWAACSAASAATVSGLGLWLSGISFMARNLRMDFGGLSLFRQGAWTFFDTRLVPTFFIFAVLAAAGIVAIAVTGLGRRTAQTLKTHRVAYLYVFPAAAGMVVLVLVPFVIGLVLGFFNHCEGRFEFVGLRNFADILSGGGAPLSHPLNFYFTLGVTILWTSVNVFLHLAIGLCLALLLRDPTLKMKGVYRVLLIIPWAVPNYITALMWKGMFHRQYGAVNMILDFFGIPAVSWFSSFWTAFSANVITNTWLGFPFMMVVCLGALQSIPQDLYEAAQVDGAGKWSTFTNITLPLLRPALMPAVILGSIWTFNMFNIIYLVSGGEPGGSTDILITEAYRWAFLRYERYGLAAAYATIIFVILLGYTYLTSRATRAAQK